MFLALYLENSSSHGRACRKDEDEQEDDIKPDDGDDFNPMAGMGGEMDFEKVRPPLGILPDFLSLTL